MFMHVILTEKPSASRNFEKAFGGKSGTYKGTPFQIVNALGHLLAFKEPEDQVGEDYVEQFKSWDVANMPWDVKQLNWKKEPIVRMNGAKKESLKPLIMQIKKAMDKADCVVIATDVDPSGEGQLLAWEIILAAGYKGKVKRINFDDEEPVSLQTAWDNLQDLPSDPRKDGEFLKADVRSKWDFLSMQLTRLSTSLTRNAGYSTVVRQGRLKSVIVKLVADQEHARKAYVRTPYYETKYKDEHNHIFGRKVGKDDDTDGIRFLSTGDASTDARQFKNPGTPVQDSISRKSTAPGKLLDLQGITGILAPQGYKPDEVIATYQKLYQAGYVSYPRTEDKFISPEQFKDLATSIDAIAKVVGVDPALLVHREPRKTHVKKGAAHGANRPGKKIPKSLSSIAGQGLSAEAIYSLLAKNSLAMFGADYEYDSVKGHIKEHPEFKTTFSIPVKQGFRAIFDTDKESSDDHESDESASGMGTSASLFTHEGANPKPPNPTIKWLSRQLEKYDVGTGATRASTIPAVSKGKTALLKETKGALSLTQTGEISAVLLEGAHIASPEVTEKLFKAMSSVGDLSMSPEKVLKTVSDIVIHDKKVFMDNQKKLQTAVGKAKGSLAGKPAKEKASGVHAPTGSTVTFNREFTTHRFTDAQVDELFAGKAVRIELKAKSGTPYSVAGVLAEADYKGKPYWSFTPDWDTREFKEDFVKKEKSEGTHSSGKSISFNREWGGHAFTEKECKDLLAGKTISFEAISKAGKDYPAKGKLVEQTYNGTKFWGFKPDFAKANPKSKSKAKAK